jgi:hypothetical protein
MQTTIKTMPLDKVEAILAHSAPFCDVALIQANTMLRYQRRLALLAEHWPEAGELLAALPKANEVVRQRVMGDPVVRSAINRGIACFKFDKSYPEIDTLADVLRSAAHHLEANRFETPLEAGANESMKLGSAPNHAWIWCDDHAEDAAGQGFRSLMARCAPTLILHTPDTETYQNLLQGLELLTQLLPELAKSAMAHVQLVAVAGVSEADWEGWRTERKRSPLESLTIFDVPGTIFVSPSSVNSPWKAAETLLHEALHEKWYDLRHTQFMLRREYRSDTSPLIRAWWNQDLPENSNQWPVCRSLAVFHVYAQLALFFTEAARQQAEFEPRYGSFGKVEPGLQARRSFDRAQYLGHQLLAHRDELGTTGVQFVEWMLSLLASFDPSPREPLAYMHLTLDLYERQTTGALNKCAKAGVEPESLPGIQALVDREVQMVERVLTALGRRWEASAIKGFGSERQWIAKVLRSLPTSDFERPLPGAPQVSLAQFVYGHVQDSGSQLNTLATEFQL